MFDDDKLTNYYISGDTRTRDIGRLYYSDFILYLHLAVSYNA